MNRTPTNSKNIYAIAHDPVAQILEVEFRENKDGHRKVYAYHPVSAELYDEVRYQPSLGSAFHANIRNNAAIVGRHVATVIDGVEQPMTQQVAS